MSRLGAVGEYLGELAGGLPSGQLRSRVLAEIEDHLREDIAARIAAGAPPRQAEQAALTAFGPAAMVARSITEEAAHDAVRRVFGLGAALLAVVIVGSDLLTSTFASVAAGWLADGPGPIAIWVIAQVALVAGAVSITRAAAYTVSRAGAAQLYIVRGMLVVVICAALTLPIGSAGLLTAPGGQRPTNLLAVAAVAVASLAVAAATARLALRAGAYLRFLGVSRQLDTTIVQDACAAVIRARASMQRRFPAVSPLLDAVTRRASAIRVKMLGKASWLPGWLDTRRHPWRFAFLALAPLAAMTVAYGIVQSLLVATGTVTWNATTAAYPSLLAAAECALALAGYVTLGPYLGLRQH